MPLRPRLFSMDPFDLVSMSPFSLMRHMNQEMERMLPRTMFGGTERFLPQIEMFERDKQLVVRADLPGISKEDIRVELNDDVLTIEGQRRYEHQDKEGGFYRSERSYGHFSRSLPLPGGVNADQCQSSFKDGVLEICFPMIEQRRGRVIEISDGSANGQSAGQNG